MNDQEIISVVNQVAHAVISASRAAADQAARVIVQSQEKSVLAMLGDYLREASVLVIIFVPV